MCRHTGIYILAYLGLELVGDFFSVVLDADPVPDDAVDDDLGHQEDGGKDYAHYVQSLPHR